MALEPHEQRQLRRSMAGRTSQAGYVLGLLLLLYLLGAYLLAPLAWEWYARRHPWFDSDPRVTQTRDGHPGDPLNIALIGREGDVRSALRAAGWQAAAALGLRSDVEIAADTLLSRPDVTAPVSDLYLYGRKEDLAFEKPVGDNPRRRHHVRFWRSGRSAMDGRPIWIGAASFDARVGLSHTTGQVTHHILPDVDAERDYLFETLKDSGAVADVYAVEGFHSVRSGRNGGGDVWQTDGRLLVGTIGSP
jgi:hypothetical protein